MLAELFSRPIILVYQFVDLATINHHMLGTCDPKPIFERPLLEDTLHCYVWIL